MKQDELKKHSYDGIQEYNNQLPRWWLGTFIITVIFGIGYWLYYETFKGPGLYDELKNNMVAHNQKYQNGSAPNSTLSEENIKTLMADNTAMDAAKVTFATNCAACHGPQGQGVIGPNLTDDYWLHGNKPDQIFNTIENGVTEKGMLAWKGVLKPEQMKGLVAYIRSLHGSSPPGAKPPQGEKLE